VHHKNSIIHEVQFSAFNQSLRMENKKTLTTQKAKAIVRAWPLIYTQRYGCDRGHRQQQPALPPST